MTYDEILQRVADRAGVSREEADSVTRAVGRTLSERLGPKEARDTASQLPKPLHDEFQPGEFAQVFDAGDFVRRVAERAGIDDVAVARERARAVFVAFQEAVQPGEFEDWETELTTDYVDLGARRAEIGQNPRTTPRDSAHRGEAFVGPNEFVERVSARAGLDQERARQAIAAVLSTFAERIARGEAEDLAQQLPEPAAEPLRHAD